MNKYQLLLLLTITFLTGCTVPGIVQSGLEVIIPVIATGLAGLITLGFKYLADWLKAKSKSQMLDNAITITNEHVGAVATELIDEYQDALVEALQDGKIDESEKEHLKQIALGTLQERFSVKELKQLAKEMGMDKNAITDYLASKVSGMLGSQLEDAITTHLTNKESRKTAVKKVSRKSTTTKKSTSKKKKRTSKK